MRPGDAITQAEAARTLGVSVNTAPKMVARGELISHRSKPSLSRRQVQAVAALRRRFRIDVTSAAGHLNVAASTLRRWLDAGIIPGHRPVGGR